MTPPLSEALVRVESVTVAWFLPSTTIACAAPAAPVRPETVIRPVEYRQGEPSPSVVKVLVPSTVTVPEPRSVATAAQWAPRVSIVRSEPLMTPA